MTPGTSIEKSMSCVYHLQSPASLSGSLSVGVVGKVMAWVVARCVAKWLKLVLFNLVFCGLLKMLVDWRCTHYFDLLTVDEDFLFSTLVQGRESSGSFHGNVGNVFYSLCDDLHALVLYFGQPAGIAFSSCGPCCCSVIHHTALSFVSDKENKKHILESDGVPLVTRCLSR